MKSLKSGASTFRAEVTGIFKTGIMVYVDKEYFLPYSLFPWFKDAKSSDVFAVKFDGFGLHWPHLDVDLELDCLRHPEKYPLVCK